MGKLWGIAALTALSLTACGGDMGNRGGDGTLTHDGTLTGGVYDDGVTNRNGMTDNGVTNRNGVTDNGVTNRNGVTDNGVTNRNGVTDNGVTNRNGMTDNGVTNRNGMTDDGVTNRNGVTDNGVTNRNGVTDFGDTARRYDNGDTERRKETVTDRDANSERSMLERASDALEDAWDGVENARERVNS